MTYFSVKYLLLCLDEAIICLLVSDVFFFGIITIRSKFKKQKGQWNIYIDKKTINYLFIAFYNFLLISLQQFLYPNKSNLEFFIFLTISDIDFITEYVPYEVCIIWAIIDLVSCNSQIEIITHITYGLITFIFVWCIVKIVEKIYNKNPFLTLSDMIICSILCSYEGILQGIKVISLGMVLSGLYCLIILFFKKNQRTFTFIPFLPIALFLVQLVKK